MNFSPFSLGVPLSTALPVATGFTAGGKLTQQVATAGGQVLGVLQSGENGIHYIRPLDGGQLQQATGQHQLQVGGGQDQTTMVSLPITVPGKPGEPAQTVQIQIPLQSFNMGGAQTVLTVAYNPNQDGISVLPTYNFGVQGSMGDLNQTIRVDGGQNNGLPEGVTVVTALQPQDIHLIQTAEDKNKDGQQAIPVAMIKTEMNKEDDNQQSGGQDQQATITAAIPAQYLQNAQVQEYLQKIPTFPLGLQQFLKFNAPDIKREAARGSGSGSEQDSGVTIEGVLSGSQEGDESLIMNDLEGEESVDDPTGAGKKRKKYKKKPPKPKKPKPGQVHIATALDGTILFCCPECHMAYPEKELLEQHLVGHKIERRFICDICGAGLKRKEHLERHKLGHNPERPFVCSVCMKGFKRKEHLNLHFVIHSGEKTEICNECGKGFYRKDHLRKHARSHVTRRAKEMAERQQQQQQQGKESTVTIQVPNSQLQIPLQIQVPQHLHVAGSSEEESNQVSTVVLPASNEVVSILPD